MAFPGGRSYRKKIGFRRRLKLPSNIRSTGAGIRSTGAGIRSTGAGIRSTGAGASILTHCDKASIGMDSDAIWRTEKIRLLKYS